MVLSPTGMSDGSAPVSQRGENKYVSLTLSPNRHSRANSVQADLDAILRDGTQSVLGREGFRPQRKCVTDTESQLNDLLSKGFSVQELSEMLYNHFEKEGHPQFLRNVRIHADGGLHRVRELWSPARWFWFAVFASIVVCNVSLLFTTNWTVLAGLMRSLQEESQSHDISLHKAVAYSTEQQTMETEHMNIFKHIHDKGIRSTVEAVAAIVAIVEVFWVCTLLARCARSVVAFFAHKSQYLAYVNLMELSEEQLQQLSSFSAIALMRFVHPSFMYSQYMDLITEFGCCHSRVGVVLLSIWFLLTRMSCLGLALGGFATKTLIVSFKLINPQFNTIVRWGGILALLNNTVKSMGVHTTSRDRVFLFVYGGADGEYQDDERALRNAYRARLGKQIFTEFRRTGELSKGLLILFTLDHFDLQSLLVDSSAPAGSNRNAAVDRIKSGRLLSDALAAYAQRNEEEALEEPGDMEYCLRERI